MAGRRGRGLGAAPPAARPSKAAGPRESSAARTMGHRTIDGMGRTRRAGLLDMPGAVDTLPPMRVLTLGRRAYAGVEVRDARLHRGARPRHRRRALAGRARPRLHPGHRRPRRPCARRRRDPGRARPTAAARSPTTGPGQVVAYPLVDLRRLGIYVKEYVFRLEQAVLQVLASVGVTGHRVRGAPGIYVRPGRPLRPRACWRRRRPAPTRFAGPGQDRRARHQGQPPLQLPRRGAERGDGPRAVRRASTPAATPGCDDGCEPGATLGVRADVGRRRRAACRQARVQARVWRR